MARHGANTLPVANAAANSQAVEQALYPGLTSHPGHDMAKRQMAGFGGVLSLLVKGGWDEAVAVASKVKLFRNATSFGGCESPREHPSSAQRPPPPSPRNLLPPTIPPQH